MVLPGVRRFSVMPPPEPDLSSDRIEAKCAIFDATHTIPALGGNAIEKMKIFASNNHESDLQEQKQAGLSWKRDDKARKIRDFCAGTDFGNSKDRILELTNYDRIQYFQSLNCSIGIQSCPEHRIRRLPLANHRCMRQKRESGWKKDSVHLSFSPRPGRHSRSGKGTTNTGRR